LPFPSTGRISLGHDASDHRLADDFTACGYAAAAGSANLAAAYGYAAAAATAAGGDANFITTFGLAAAAAGSNISVRLRQAG
jgi:hypothetical protein